MRVRTACLALGLVLAAPAVAAPDQSTSLGVFQNWSAYSNGDGGQKVCYALAQPKASAPKKKRDKIYFLISDWPGRRAKGEIEIVPGYQYKDGSDVTLQVGAQKFPLFTKNDGDAGSAWVKDVSQENAMIQAMRNASSATVTGTSTRGTAIKDTYSLTGLGDALDKAHAACSM
jgi:invasion protein IalB